MSLDTAAYLSFLICVAALHAVLPPRGRIPLLLGASLVFYAVSSVSYLVLLLALCGFNYATVLGLGRTVKGPRRTAIFATSAVINIAVLILFKYATHLIGTALTWVGRENAEKITATRIAAPLGLSYFTFQMLACLTDVYRRALVVEDGLTHFVLFGFFFPQISSGPIPRAKSLMPQFAGGQATRDDRLYGLRLIAFGLFKKFVVANRLTEYVGNVFGGNLPVSALPTAIACCFNALWVYADFSSYVDIAIGSARLFGIRLDPNFDRPFVSTSVTEFWRRWHITLSFWLRDYLFKPILFRIRRIGNMAVALSLVATFAICGLWHAAKWLYLVLFTAQGVAMSVELLTRTWRAQQLAKLPKVLVACTGWLYTVAFFVLGQVLFRAVDFLQAGRVYSQLFHMKLPQSSAELFAFKGPLFFALDFAVVGIWFALASWLPKLDGRTTPFFLFACAVLVLFLGRLGSPHFLYVTY